MVNIISLNGKTYEISNYKNDVLFKEWKGYLVLREIPQPQTPQHKTSTESLSFARENERHSRYLDGEDKTGETHNQEKEFCLSDKIHPCCGEPNCKDCLPSLHIEDVKEFIRRLKEKDFIMSILAEDVTADDEEQMKFIDIEGVRKKIDKLAGEKLK